MQTLADTLATEGNVNIDIGGEMAFYLYFSYNISTTRMITSGMIKVLLILHIVA